MLNDIAFLSKSSQGDGMSLAIWDHIVGTGTIFRMGEQKLVKNNQDNQIQKLYAICIFEKEYTQRTKGSEAKHQKVGKFREFLC